MSKIKKIFDGLNAEADVYNGPIMFLPKDRDKIRPTIGPGNIPGGRMPRLREIQFMNLLHPVEEETPAQLFARLQQGAQNAPPLPPPALVGGIFSTSQTGMG